jgi:serine/threonine protein kinase
MELVKGTLFQFLEHVTRPIPLHVQLDFSCDIACALSYLHEKSIVHGNLSSCSVLLIHKGQVKVSDYEVRSLYSHLTVEQMEPQTLPYLPPEAFFVPAVLSEKSDCFSWSVLVLQIATQLFPNPSPRVQNVTDPRLFAKPLKTPVSEVSRRKSHIDLVGDSNPLLSVLVVGLDDDLEKRPAMEEISRMVSLMKESDEYKRSQVNAGDDWSERQMILFDYELVRILEDSLSFSASHNEAERIGSQLGRLSLENESQTESGHDATAGVGVAEGIKKAAAASREPEATTDISSPPLYSEVCLSSDSEAACRYEVPVLSPPPYTLLPPEYPQRLPSSSFPQEQAQGQRDFQCAVCKHKNKYQMLPGQKVGLVRCPKCRECTPVTPPPDGKVYGRCAFCKCLIAYSPSSKALVCPRENCKNVLFVSNSEGKMMRRVPCEVCGYVMRIARDARDLVVSTLHLCSQCGEVNVSCH